MRDSEIFKGETGQVLFAINQCKISDTNLLALGDGTAMLVCDATKLSACRKITFQNDIMFDWLPASSLLVVAAAFDKVYFYSVLSSLIVKHVWQGSHVPQGLSDIFCSCEGVYIHTKNALEIVRFNSRRMEWPTL